MYRVSDGGVIVLPGGRVLEAGGWLGFGDDFVHVPDGAYLRGDTGWIGQIDNWEALRGALNPGTVSYTAVADDTGLYLVPVGAGSEDLNATYIPLTATVGSAGVVDSGAGSSGRPRDLS
jgi:hypothetical protein